MLISGNLSSTPTDIKAREVSTHKRILINRWIQNATTSYFITVQFCSSLIKIHTHAGLADSLRYAGMIWLSHELPSHMDVTWERSVILEWWYAAGADMVMWLASVKLLIRSLLLLSEDRLLLIILSSNLRDCVAFLQLYILIPLDVCKKISIYSVINLMGISPTSPSAQDTELFRWYNLLTHVQ